MLLDTSPCICWEEVGGACSRLMRFGTVEHTMVGSSMGTTTSWNHGGNLTTGLLGKCHMLLVYMCILPVLPDTFSFSVSQVFLGWLLRKQIWFLITVIHKNFAVEILKDENILRENFY